MANQRNLLGPEIVHLEKLVEMVNQRNLLVPEIVQLEKLLEMALQMHLFARRTASLVLLESMLNVVEKSVLNLPVDRNQGHRRLNPRSRRELASLGWWIGLVPRHDH